MRSTRFHTRGLILLATLAAVTSGPTLAPAVTLHWDGDGDGTLGGSGTWNTSGLNSTPNGQWSTSATTPGNPGPYGAWDQTGGQDVAAVFFSAINQTITVSGTVNVNQLNITSPNSANPNDVITGGVINLTGVATINLSFVVDAPNQWITLNSTITGSNGLTTSGKGQIELGGNNTYTGMTTFNNIRNNDLTSSTAIPAGSILNLGNTVRIRPGVNTTAAGLIGAGSLQFQGGGTTGGITLSRNDGGTSTYTGMLFLNNGTALRSFTKAGNYVQILAGGSTHNTMKSVDVQGGILALAKTAGFDAIGNNAITITGGTLRLDADNQINDAADMTLSGGTFNLNGNDETLDALTLTADSVIDFGSAAGSNILAFTSGSRTGGQLNILNWVGNPGIGGGTDQLRFTAAPDAAFLANVRFVGHHPNAIAVNQGSFFEVVPIIPEPASAALLTTGVALISRRRK